MVRCGALALVVALLTGPVPAEAVLAAARPELPTAPRSSATAPPTSTTTSPSTREGGPVATLDPVAQAALLAPLRAAAAALDAVGRHDLPDAYAGVALDAPDARTDLYLTDPGAAPALVARARRTDPGLTLADVTVHPAAFPLAVLEAASRRAVDSPEPYAVDAAYPAPDGSGVRVEVSDPAAAARTTGTALRAAGPDGRSVAVPVTFLAGTPRVPHDWDDVKWHDSAPFIGGDVLTTDGHRYCTAGLPAVRVKDHRPVMVTAAHCFGTGQRVYTGAGKTWDYRDGRTGRYVGTVTTRNRSRDAEVLVGTANDADESDTSGWKPLTSVAYSYRGDVVCHAGARSAADGHPTPCGIEVTIDDLYFREAGHTVRGVEGVDVHGWGSVGGDSGGTVFAVEADGDRQLRGMVSTGGADGTVDQRRVDWPEAVDVFKTLKLKLNPKT